MEENSELEEGEPHCHNGDKDNFDPDTDLSYIDEKVQHILGHHRKDFEGGVSKEILGAKFGGYGSFLPAHERSPSNCSHAKTPQSDSNKPISQCNLSMEGTSQNFQPISNVSSFMRIGTVSCSDHSLQNSGVSSGDVPMKHDLRLSSARVAEKFNIKDESSSGSGNLTDPRTLRVRIKVSSNKIARKNMAIYSGLGLDNSPLSSLGNSAEESGGMNPVSGETADESPTSILQVMTSFPVPGGVIVSPLHESLLCLIRKERLLRDREHVSSLKGSQEHSAMSVDKSVASMGNRKLLKEKKVNLLGKISRPVEQKHGTDAKDENDTAFLKKKLENETPGGKEINHNNAIHMSLSNPGECVFGSVKGLGRASEVSRGVDKDEVSDRLFSSNLERDDSFESISGHSGKTQKNGKSRSVVKVSEQMGTNSHHEVLGYIGDSGGYKERKTHALLKARSGASKCNDGPIVLSKQKLSIKPSMEVQDEIKSCTEREVPLVEGKKPKCNRSRGKAGSFSIKESLRDGVAVAPKSVATTGYGASTCQNKMEKLKSQKDTNKASIHEDSLDTNLEQTNNQLERTSSNKPSKKVDSQVMHELSIKDASFMVPSTFEGKPGTEMVPAGDPVVINENWVCCDNCYKWRLLPFGTIPEHLPDNWLCSMLNWLPGMNHCDISEEQTTKALHALYQLPVTEGQNNLQSYANGPASVITLDHGQHLDQKHQSPDSAAVSVRAKKRAGDNGGIQISNTTKNRPQDSVKSRSINDKNQPPSESNEMKRSSSLYFIKSCNSDLNNSITKQKKEQMNGGDSEKLKMKQKRAANQRGYGSSKKAKIEVTYTTDRHRNSAVDHGKLVLKPNAGLQTEASGKNILNEPEDAQCDARDRLLLSRKKLGGQARVLSVGGSLDVRTQDKRNNSQTKRKWQDNQNGHDSKEYAKEEGSESGLGREKKSRVQKTESRKFSGNKGADDKSNNRGLSLFSTKGYMVDGMADVRSVDVSQKNWKNRRDFASQQTSNAIESVRKHSGSGEVSVAATSSSSKVSSSCKNRADYEVVKGSPAESVSSSPFRTSSHPDKLTSTAEDILGKDDGGTDCVLANNNCKRFLAVEGNGEINRSGTASKENNSSNFHPEPTKFPSFDYHDGNVNHKSTQKSKVPSEFGNGCFLNGDADSFERHQHISDMHVIEHRDGESRGNQNSHENVLLPQKVDLGYFLPPKDSNRSYASHRDKMKVFDSSSGHGDLYLKRSLKYESDVVVDHNAPYCEVICEGKNRFPERSRSKLHKKGKNHISRRDHERQMPSDGRMEKQVMVREQHDSDVKLCASTEREDASQWNLMQDLDSEVNPTQLERETVKGMSMLLSSEKKNGQSKKGCLPVPGSQQGQMFNEVLIDNSCKADVTKAAKYPENEGKKNELSLGLGHHSPDAIQDLNAPIDISMKSSSQNATIALKQAKELRDYGDRLKGSGFDFESNEAYFQSALKFFHGASLQETCNGESGRNGDMTHLQGYSTTAKLCEFCGQEYERRQEMAAASLAYKCMEVAYMRVVYCKQSSTSRDLTELQATLLSTSQGESPSSSASDVDNLNNQMTADKSLTSKGKGSHVTGSHIVFARNRPSFIRLLDLTRDVDLAMEASRKSWNTFAVASVTKKEAQNRESITIIKKVIDFSFQDVEGFLRLVRLAMEAINRSDFGVVRD